MSRTLKIWMQFGWRTFFVNVHMHATIGASRSSRLFVVHYRAFRGERTNGRTNKRTIERTYTPFCRNVVTRQHKFANRPILNTNFTMSFYLEETSYLLLGPYPLNREFFLGYNVSTVRRLNLYNSAKTYEFFKMKVQRTTLLFSSVSCSMFDVLSISTVALETILTPASSG